MRVQLLSAFALVALSLGLHSIAPRAARAQVVIQGEVTYTGGDVAPNQEVPAAPRVVSAGAPGYTAATYTQPLTGPQPARYVHRSAPNAGLLVTGVVLLAGGYLTDIIGTFQISGWASDAQYYVPLVPVLGPFLQLGLFPDVDAALADGIGYFSLFTGIAQVLGVVFIGLGVAIQDEWDEPRYALGDDPSGPSLAFDGSRLTLTF